MERPSPMQTEQMGMSYTLWLMMVVIINTENRILWNSREALLYENDSSYSELPSCDNYIQGRFSCMIHVPEGDDVEEVCR